MQRAWALLSQTEDSVAQIAMACGFNSTSHFTKVYRAHYGRAPLAHRTLMH
jgi:transcriptional regulator GlxA family with amidase domain